MAKRDFYEILGVSRDADVKTIKQAYRRLAMEFHPDRNPGNPEAEARFKEASEAYGVLSDPEKKQLYDRYGHEGLQGQGGFSGVEDIFSSFGDIFSEFFAGDIFGRRRSSRPPRPARGADVRYDLILTFEEALRGTKKVIEIEQLRRCLKCDGIGAAPGTSPTVCPTCQGHGQVVQRTGFMTLATTCPTCGGRGHTIETPCKECSGTGRAPFTRKVTATVPAGVDTGMRLRIASEGEEPDNGGPRGDLYIFITVEQHERFFRDGNDLLTRVEIPYTAAILGQTVEVDLVGEAVRVDIAPGTQPSQRLRIEGKGAPFIGRAGAGDLFVEVIVTIPKTLSKKQKELISLLEKLHREAEAN